MFLSYKWRDNRSNALACILKISVCKRIDSIREVVRLMLAHPTVLVPDTSLTSFSSRISQEMHPYVTDYLINYILWNQQRSRFLESCTWGVYNWCYLLLLNCFPETDVWFFHRQFKYGEIFWQSLFVLTVYEHISGIGSSHFWAQFFLSLWKEFHTEKVKITRKYLTISYFTSQLNLNNFNCNTDLVNVLTSHL